MSDAKTLATAFLQKNRGAPALPFRGAPNAFNALFEVQELSERDSQAIDQILTNGIESSLLSEATIQSDVFEVKRITKELRAIRRQERILIGGRIAAARAIFQKYTDRSFKEWMEFAFGSFKTGYNYLAYYDLYTAIPDLLKNRFKEMPAKAAYILASKKAPIEQKTNIVEKHSTESAKTIITAIQETLGPHPSKKPKKKSAIDQILDFIENDTRRLIRKQGQLNPKQLKRAKHIADRIFSLFSALKF